MSKWEDKLWSVVDTIVFDLGDVTEQDYEELELLIREEYCKYTDRGQNGVTISDDPTIVVSVIGGRVVSISIEDYDVKYTVSFNNYKKEVYVSEDCKTINASKGMKVLFN